jgi:rare lipoprotein A
MAKLNTLKLICLYITLIIVSACSTHTSRYQQKHDSTPTRVPNANELLNATPRAEAHSRGGNKHYQVFGKHYKVLKTAENFSQTGTASWYGKKFHGHLTSNGEIYDMYAMSAAHKNLPLPTYLKVVNNSNGKFVIVRVNDRGPFHQDRIIDLSYSAAYKLDMLKTGTANVTITAINDFTAETLAQLQHNLPHFTSNTTETVPLAQAEVAKVANSPTVKPLKKELSLTNLVLKKQFIQVFASKSKLQASKISQALMQNHNSNTQIEEINGIFRVLVGPILTEQELSRLLAAIKDSGYPKAFIRR